MKYARKLNAHYKQLGMYTWPLYCRNSPVPSRPVTFTRVKFNETLQSCTTDTKYDAHTRGSPSTSGGRLLCQAAAYPGFFFGAGSTNSVENRGQRERGSGGGSPLLRGSGGSCNLVQEISFHIVKFS